MAQAPQLHPSEQLPALAGGAWVTQMIHVAAELGLADQLAGGARDVSELAQAWEADADSLFRLLRGLASLGIFEETAPRRFALTPLAELLRGDHPQSLRQLARMLGEEHDLPGRLLDLNMLVMTEGGRERTPQEVAQLLEGAGLRLPRIVPTAGRVSVVEAVAS